MSDDLYIVNSCRTGKDPEDDLHSVSKECFEALKPFEDDLHMARWSAVPAEVQDALWESPRVDMTDDDLDELPASRFMWVRTC